MSRSQRKKRRDIGRFEEHKNRVFYRAHTYENADYLSDEEAIAAGLNEYLAWREDREQEDDA